MMRLRIAPLARADLAQIRDYIARDNPSAADTQIDAFFDRFHMLARNPEMGEARPDLGPDLRVFTVGSYLIVFRSVAKGVEVARVMSGYRDISELF
jgi:plasmid stabilization system protein ParE